MNDLKDFIVPWVFQSEPYNADHLDFAWEHPDVIRMMSNENPLPPSQSVLDAILEAAGRGNLYPDSGRRLRAAIAERVGLDVENIVLGNGSTDIISIVISTFVAPGEEVIIPSPTFSMYAKRAKILGGVPVEIPMTSSNYWDVYQIIASVNEKTKLIFICSPNNPTGNLIREEDLKKILELGIPTFFDEAYFELTEDQITYAPMVEYVPHLMVSRTFSKAYGLAGLRVGYLFCGQGLANYLNRVKNPWNVSLLAYSAALAALEDKEGQIIRRNIIRQGREWLVQHINQLPSIHGYASEGNYILFDASHYGKSSKELVGRLIKKGVYVRPMDSHGMENGFMRVTVGTEEQNAFFFQQLVELVEELTTENS